MLERLPRLEGRELNFGAYVMTAARNASYDAIARRKRATPAGDIPESAVPVLAGGDDPDRPDQEALREAHQEQIRLANESLPPRQREALALRELEELSYDEVAEIMGMNRNSVAQLISRARINLRDGLRQTALGSVAATSELCDRALPLLALRQDGVLDDDASADWLAGHLVGCGTCRVRVDAMEEAGVAYRMWLPLVPALWLKTEAVARAAERVGADWSAFAGDAARPRAAPAARRRRRRRARDRLRARARGPRADADAGAGRARPRGAGRRRAGAGGRRAAREGRQAGRAPPRPPGAQEARGAEGGRAGGPRARGAARAARDRPTPRRPTRRRRPRRACGGAWSSARPRTRSPPSRRSSRIRPPSRWRTSRSSTSPSRRDRCARGRTAPAAGR